ncbi:unnamed protein product [Pleuronectes platessa]|uniref:Uncharacterized protein n=1 Tax=Pleuronectes platessa TaxID=8262 RepID=A0A9N7UGA0_PLEPL|nr:unnamed protein product [Pleuronectes platessa]
MKRNHVQEHCGVEVQSCSLLKPTGPLHVRRLGEGSQSESRSTDLSSIHVSKRNATEPVSNAVARRQPVVVHIYWERWKSGRRLQPGVSEQENWDEDGFLSARELGRFVCEHERIHFFIFQD